MKNSKQEFLFKDLPLSNKVKINNKNEFSNDKNQEYNNIILKNNYESVGSNYQDLYDVIFGVIKHFRLIKIEHNQINLFIDLIIARIVSPVVQNFIQSYF